MGLRIICVLSLVLLAAQNVLCTVWEFGEDVPKSKVIFHYEGQMSNSEKTKHVQIVVPECSYLKYVRVQVDNPLSTPKTSYDEMARTVTIEYEPSQNSVSKYDVVAKGIDICIQNKMF